MKKYLQLVTFKSPYPIVSYIERIGSFLTNIQPLPLGKKLKKHGIKTYSIKFAIVYTYMNIARDNLTFIEDSEKVCLLIDLLDNYDEYKLSNPKYFSELSEEFSLFLHDNSSSF